MVLNNLTWVTIGYDKLQSGINSLGLISMGTTLEYVLEHSKQKEFENYDIQAFEISNPRKFADECVAWIMRVSRVSKDVAV